MKATIMQLFRMPLLASIAATFAVLCEIGVRRMCCTTALGAAEGRDLYRSIITPASHDLQGM
jgi:hypothetical protein